MTDTPHTIESLVRGWKEHEATCKLTGTRAISTKDPRLLAGAYLEYANRNLTSATHTLGVHCSGEYVDMPRFTGCDDALRILKELDV